MPERGFSKVKIVVLVIGIALIGGGSILLLSGQASTPEAKVQTGQGSTHAVDAVAEDEGAAETAIDSSFAKQDQSGLSNADKAADNVGGAYDDADL